MHTETEKQHPRRRGSCFPRESLFVLQADTCFLFRDGETHRGFGCDRPASPAGTTCCFSVSRRNHLAIIAGTETTLDLFLAVENRLFRPAGSRKKEEKG